MGSSTAGSGSVGVGPEHQDCNGKTAHPHHHALILAEVFPQLKARKDRADTDEEIDYVSTIHIY